MTETDKEQLQHLFRLFPNLTEKQQHMFEALGDLYRDWNEKINVISRKDIENLYIHHVLHSLGIAKIIRFRPESRILDVGTGGGFPGIPLAILFPEVSFRLIDSIGKKIRVASDIISSIGLTNAEAVHRNVMEEHERYDFVVSRAVMNSSDLVRLVRKNISSAARNSLPNGLVCLKGGDLQAELAPFRKKAETWNLDQYFDDPFFETKKVIYIPLQ